MRHTCVGRVYPFPNPPPPGQPWSALVSPGQPWSARGQPWSALVSPGRPWSARGQPCSARVISGQPWSALVSPGQPWSALKALQRAKDVQVPVQHAERLFSRPPTNSQSLNMTWCKNSQFVLRRIASSGGTAAENSWQFDAAATRASVPVDRNVILM